MNATWYEEFKRAGSKTSPHGQTDFVRVVAFQLAAFSQGGAVPGVPDADDGFRLKFRISIKTLAS